MPMGRGCNMPRQACCVDTIQQVAWHESGPLRCESNNSLPGRLSLQQKPTIPGTNEAQQPDPYRRQQRSRRAMERVCRSRALSQIWARLQCDQSVSSVADLNAECGLSIFLTSEEAEKIESPMPYRRVSECGV